MRRTVIWPGGRIGNGRKENLLIKSFDRLAKMPAKGIGMYRCFVETDFADEMEKT